MDVTNLFDHNCEITIGLSEMINLNEGQLLSQGEPHDEKLFVDYL